MKSRFVRTISSIIWFVTALLYAIRLLPDPASALFSLAHPVQSFSSRFVIIEGVAPLDLLSIAFYIISLSFALSKMIARKEDKKWFQIFIYISVLSFAWPVLETISGACVTDGVYAMTDCQFGLSAALPAFVASMVLTFSAIAAYRFSKE